MISSIEDILTEAKKGKPFVIIDAEDRENEGDVVIPAQFATPEQINFMAKYARGLICLALTRERANRLKLSPMTLESGARHSTAFTVAIEAREGVTTGISAFDRAHTIKVAIDPEKSSEDLVKPGHVFPLIAKDGGVLVRAGHTEAAVDIARLAGLAPSGVICEIMNDDGTMARLDDLKIFAKEHGLKIGTIADLIAYRRRTECFVDQVAKSIFHSKEGHEFKLFVYRNRLDGAEHLALVRGQPTESAPTLVRMHQFDLVHDALFELTLHGEGDLRSGLISKALKIMAQYDGPSVLVILRDPDPKALSARFDDLGNSIAQPRELRDYGVGAQILRDLGVRDMISLSTTRPKPTALEGYDLRICDFLALK